MNELPHIEMEIKSETINATPKKLSSEWTLTISPWTICYYEDGVSITNFDTGQSRNVTNLLARIHEREKYNVRLGARAQIDRLHVLICGSRTKKITPSAIRYMLYCLISEPRRVYDRYRRWGL